MARSRTSSSPAPAADRLVLPLQSVMLNGRDPRAEMDGVAELVIKGEREILPGISWTENLSGIYPTTQIMTVLCGNHTLEMIDLGRFARESAKDVLLWRVDRGFIDLTFEYPLSGSRRASVREPAATQGPSSQPASTHQRLRLTFASHDAFSKTCISLEMLGILRPEIRIQRPHSLQLPVGPGRPRSDLGSRPASAQAMAPPLHRPSPSLSERLLSSSPHPSPWNRGSQLSMTPPNGGEQASRARSLSRMPTSVARPQSPMELQKYGPPILTRSPYFQPPTASPIGSLESTGNVSSPVAGRSRFDGAPSPYRFHQRRTPAQAHLQAREPLSQQQGIRKTPRKVIRGAISSPSQPSIAGGLPALFPARPDFRATPLYHTPTFSADTGLPPGSRASQISSQPRIADEAMKSVTATSTLQPAAHSPLFFSSTSCLWKLFLEKSDAAMKAAGDSEEAKSRVISEFGHEFALAFTTLCGSTGIGS